jgi:hypothetical protein
VLADVTALWQPTKFELVINLKVAKALSAALHESGIGPRLPN